MSKNSLSQTFESVKFYVSTTVKRPVQGSILQRHSIERTGDFYEARDITPAGYTVDVPNLGPVYVPADADPIYVIRAARAKATPRKAKRPARRRNTRQTVNYAVLALV